MTNEITEYRQAEAKHLRALRPLFTLPLSCWSKINWRHIERTRSAFAAVQEKLSPRGYETIFGRAHAEKRRSVALAHVLAVASLFAPEMVQ